MYAGSVANRPRGEAAQCSATQSEAIRQVARGGVYSGVKLRYVVKNQFRTSLKLLDFKGLQSY